MAKKHHKKHADFVTSIMSEADQIVNDINNVTDGRSTLAVCGAIAFYVEALYKTEPDWMLRALEHFAKKTIKAL